MNKFPGGVWPVMLTPYTENGEIDTEALAALTEWYISNGVKGLFAACQSSEIQFLSLEERKLIVETTIKAAKGRVPVIASGHISDDMDSQVRELSTMAEAGADALILITNHLAKKDEDDDVWCRNFDTLLSRLDPAIPMGAYECPAPYKRLLTEKTIRHMAETGRFYFLKDTCCSAIMIKERLKAIEGTSLGLYNANSATLLTTLLDGARGFSGVMANMHPELYVWLTANIHHVNAPIVQAAIATGSLIERQVYPVCAKWHLRNIEKLPITTFCRSRDRREFTEPNEYEVRALDAVMNDIYERYCK